MYKIDKEQINSALTALFSLVNVQVEDSVALFGALTHHAHGMDFAGALHLASSQRADTFATFGEKLRTRTKTLQIKQ